MGGFGPLVRTRCYGSTQVAIQATGRGNRRHVSMRGAGEDGGDGIGQYYPHEAAMGAGLAECDSKFVELQRTVLLGGNQWGMQAIVKSRSTGDAHLTFERQDVGRVELPAKYPVPHEMLQLCFGYAGMGALAGYQGTWPHAFGGGTVGPLPTLVPTPLD